jgi:AAA15 family ATPase/GTPase
MTATKVTEHSNRVVSIANDSLLRVAAIYGANASGKSNLYDAFRFMSMYVIHSDSFSSDDSKKKRKPMSAKPFRFDKVSPNNTSTYEVFFIDKTNDVHRTYQYGFCLKGSTVIEEWLFDKPKSAREYRTIFYRDIESNQLDFDGIHDVQADNIRSALRPERLIVSLGEILSIPKLMIVYNWFYKNEVFDSSNDHQSFYFSNRLPKGFIDDIDVQRKVVEYFSSFDDSIVGFDIKRIAAEGIGNDENEDEKEWYVINARHKIADTDDFAVIPLQDESKGTLKMFSLYPYIQYALNNGSVLFVDELNTRLHPLLVRNIVLTFANPAINTKNAQLVFTTHDTWHLSNNLLRRDEIWFTEKDASGVSTLFSLVDFISENGTKIRKDENYEKNYLYGKYGAIPSLNTIDLLKDGAES